MPAPAVAEDIVEIALNGVVAVVAANADIQTITGRASNNVVAWNAIGIVDLPVIVYRATVATVTGSPRDTREIMFLFGAIAETEAEVNALLGVLDAKILWAPALAALSPPIGPIDAYMTNPVRRGIPWDSDEDQNRGDLEMTLVITV